MQRLEVSGAVRPIYGSLGVKRLMLYIPPVPFIFYNQSKALLLSRVIMRLSLSDVYSFTPTEYKLFFFLIYYVSIHATGSRDIQNDWILSGQPSLVGRLIPAK